MFSSVKSNFTVGRNGFKFENSTNLRFFDNFRDLFVNNFRRDNAAKD